MTDDVFSFDCECGKCIRGSIDGYGFGDTLLEGVKFQVEICENGEKLRLFLEGCDYEYVHEDLAKAICEGEELCCENCHEDTYLRYNGELLRDFDDRFIIGKIVIGG